MSPSELRRLQRILRVALEMTKDAVEDLSVHRWQGRFIRIIFRSFTRATTEAEAVVLMDRIRKEVHEQHPTWVLFGTKYRVYGRVFVVELTYSPL